jgi:hypothetical protein
MRYENGRNVRTSPEEHDVSLDTSGGHPAMDYDAHTDTYARFLRLTKAAIAFLVVLLIGMKIFLV